MKTMMLSAVLAVGVAAPSFPAEGRSDLGDLEAKYEKAQASIDAELTKQKAEALSAYGTTLDTYLAYAKRQGKLDAFLSLKKEKDRFLAKRTVPAEEERKDEYTIRIGLQYDLRIAKAIAGRNTRTEHLIRQYIVRLDALIKELMLADNIAGAKLVKAEKMKMDFVLADVQSRMPQSTVTNAVSSASRVKIPESQPAVPPKNGYFFNTGGRMNVLEKRRLEEHKAKYPVPKNATEYKGHHYFAVTDKATWDEARRACAKMGGHLVTIKDVDEYVVVRNLGIEWPSIGMFDEDERESRKWAWVDGTKGCFSTDISRWKPPNSGPCRYGYINSRGSMNGALGVRSDSAKPYPYICEWDY